MKLEKKKAESGDDLDLKIAVMLAQNMLEEGGFDVIEKALAGSSDPAQVIGQFLMQLGQQLLENMPEGMEINPGILLARGGWLEQISDYIQEELDVKAGVMDKAEIYVASTAQQMAESKQQPQQAAPAGPPVMPEGVQ